MTTPVTVAHIVQWIDELAPFRFAESWDNCGLQVGDPRAEVSRVLVALDPSLHTVREAARRRCQALVTHHPLFSKAVSTLSLDGPPGSVVAEAIRGNVHIVSAHTNLDAALHGTNDTLARAVGLAVHGPLEENPAAIHDPRYVGLGLYGLLPEPCSALDLAESLARLVGIRSVRLVGNPEKSVQKVALCTGSGMSLLGRAIQHDCHVFITGDVKYHDAHTALDQGIVVIDIGHFASEAFVVAPLADALAAVGRSRGAVLEVMTSIGEKDPFVTVIFNENRRECVAGAIEISGGAADSGK
uniref:GTP cyclohydrolase 1 type 2 homolog n=1 Tax=Desulfacinum infernum TaxID=35837 RepID=A0A831ZW64_9BACT